MTTHLVDYIIDDEKTTVDITIKVVEGEIFTVKDFIDSLADENNNDIQNYHIASLSLEFVNEID